MGCRYLTFQVPPHKYLLFFWWLIAKAVGSKLGDALHIVGIIEQIAQSEKQYKIGALLTNSTASCLSVLHSRRKQASMAECPSLGILIDIVDEEWMRDTLPDDGTLSSPKFP